MRLLLDEQHDPEVARQLRARGHDVNALAALAGIRGLSDVEVVDLAVSERRAIVTEDVRDFVVEHRRRLAARIHHFGIVLTSARRYPRNDASLGKLVAALDGLLRAHTADAALRDRLVWLPEDQDRQRERASGL